MRRPIRFRFIRPSTTTLMAVGLGAATIVFSATFLLTAYASLPDILPVHFMRDGNPNGWQYKNYARVLMPVFVQIALASTLGAVAGLLLSRPHGRFADRHNKSEDDDAGRDQDDDHHHDEGVKAASTAAEAVVLLAVIWVTFQAYAAIALVNMWHRGHGDLGTEYSIIEGAGVLVSVFVAVRALVRLGQPLPRPYVSEHWRFGRLYRNPLDPALFVPTRDGSRWTLNFGRPVAVILMGLLLAIGMIVPSAILALLLR